MELVTKIKQIAKKYNEQKDIILTEEASKTSLVMPFIAALGYDVFDPTEVIPEYTADARDSRGRRVDFALKQDGKIAILIECKPCTASLSEDNAIQLAWYFPHVPDAKFGILTNGLEYQFFSDLSDKNVLDPKPFFCFDIRKLSTSDAKTLEQFGKPNFNVDKMLGSATELKYTGEIKRYIAEQFVNPSDSFTRCLIDGIGYPGRIWSNILEQFKSYSKNALNLYLNEKLNERLESAMKQGEDDHISKESNATPMEESSEDNGIVTTQEEIDAFNIIRAILRKRVGVKRVVMKDAKSYCAIHLDNSSYPLARLYFNNPQNLQIAYLDPTDMKKKIEIRKKIESLDDIYSHEDELMKPLDIYLALKSK